MQREWKKPDGQLRKAYLAKWDRPAHSNIVVEPVKADSDRRSRFAREMTNNAFRQSGAVAGL